RQDAGQHPVDQRGGQVHGEDLEGTRGNQLRLAEQLRHLDGGGQGGVLDQRDEAVAQRRQRGARGLGQDGAVQGLCPTHADARRRFPLTTVDGGDGGAQDLGSVGAHVQREADQGGGQRLQLD